MPEKTMVLNIQFNNVTIEKAAQDILQMVKSGGCSYVVTPNSEIAESCFKDSNLLNAVKSAQYVLPDGAGIVIASKICGHPLKARSAGYDVVCKLLEKLQDKQESIYLLGSKPGIAQKAAEKMKAAYKGLNVAGFHHGYFHDKDDDKIIMDIKNSKADVLLVALGSPRQEFFMYRNRDKFTNIVMIGVGGSLDVFAGEAKRAPDIFIRLNLEWLYRLLKQPYRIGRMMKLPAYLWRAILWRISGKTNTDN